MANSRRYLLLVLVVGVSLLSVLVGIRLTQPDVCDEVSRGLGGCDNLYRFVATDCVAVGEEFGSQLDERIVAVLSGSETVNDESRGVRINHLWTVGITRAHQHLERNQIPCDGSQFMEVAEEQFSPALRAGVGPAMYYGGQATYAEWLDEVASASIGIIGSQESTEPSSVVSPAGGPPSVTGTITAGPVCPVESSPPDPACAPRPVAGAVIVATDATGQEVGRSVSASDGSYLLIVGETGTVLISALPVAGLVNVPAPVDVTLVSPSQVERIDLEYDTGIR